MKGAELPISTIVIIIVVILVAIGILALYNNGYFAWGSVTNVETAKNDACYELVRNKCFESTSSILVSNFDANNNGRLDPGTTWDWTTGTGDDNLAALCYNYYSATTENLCKRKCNCDVGTSGGGSRPCTPLTCTDLGYECKTWNDGCGGTIDCGICAAGETCIAGKCGFKLTVFGWVDFGISPDPVVANVNVNVNGNIGTTDGSGIVELAVKPGAHTILVDSVVGGRSFSHFWDSDCDAVIPGQSLDTNQNPYPFNMIKDRNMTAFYRKVTHITNTAKVFDTFEFDGSFIKGKLLDENRNSINTTWYGRCDSCGLCVGPGSWDKKITLEYSTDNGVTWIPINTVIATPWPGDGSWSQAWTNTFSANKLRARYIPNDPKDWYCDSSSAIINIGAAVTCPDSICDVAGGECDTCPADCTLAACCGPDPKCNAAVGENSASCPSDCALYKLTFYADKNVPTPIPIQGIQVTVDILPPQTTDALGKTEFTLTKGVHTIKVTLTPLYTFTHFWDQDCDQTHTVPPWYWDFENNPYTFTMYDRDRAITAYYKISTQITDFNYDGTTISGKLLDTEVPPRAIVGGPRNKHPVCEDSIIDNKNVPVDRDVILEYSIDNGATWNPIDTVTATPFPGDGSWSKAWNCKAVAPLVNKLRARYISANMFYEGIVAEKITICNRPPVASFTENREDGLVGTSINFDATGSSDPDGDPLTYSWNFGDGTFAVGAITSHAYSSTGTFTVTLTVSDGKGGTNSKTATKTIVASCTCSWTAYQCGGSVFSLPACEFDGSCLEWYLCRCIPAGCGDAFNNCNDITGTGSEGDYICSFTLCGQNFGPNPDC